MQCGALCPAERGVIVRNSALFGHPPKKGCLRNLRDLGDSPPTGAVKDLLPLKFKKVLGQKA